MNQMTWQGKLRQLRGEFKREWGKFTHNDRQRIEGEFDRIIGQMQQQYGYNRQRAWNELARYWQAGARCCRSQTWQRQATKPFSSTYWTAGILVGLSLWPPWFYSYCRPVAQPRDTQSRP